MGKRRREEKEDENGGEKGLQIMLAPRQLVLGGKKESFWSRVFFLFRCSLPSEKDDRDSKNDIGKDLFRVLCEAGILRRGLMGEKEMRVRRGGRSNPDHQDKK